MSDFVSNKLKQIDLGNEKWIKIPEEISFGEVQNFSKGETDEVVIITQAMLVFIKEWNLEDKNGKAEINKENINKLKITTINIITEAITNLISANSDKKKEVKEEKN